MLTAQQQDGTQICTLHYSREQLRTRRTEQFYCRDCQAAVTLKIGRKNIPHFAHKSVHCHQFSSERESPTHLAGKAALYSFFQQHCHDVQLEMYIQQIAQRPDVLIDQTYAIEFQCSTIPLSFIEQRTDGYISANYIPIWILHAKHTALGWNILSLTQFEQYFFQDAHTYPYLLLFQPEQQVFYYYTSCIQVSKTKFLCYVQQIPLQAQTFPFYTPAAIPLAIYLETIDTQRQHRERYLEHSRRFNTQGVHHRILRLAYDHFGGVAYTPFYIGVYIPNAFCFNMHPFDWQLLFVVWRKLHRHAHYDEFQQWAQLAMFTPIQYQVLEQYEQILQTPNLASLSYEQLFTYIHCEIVAQ